MGDWFSKGDAGKGSSDVNHVRGTGTSSAVIYCEVVISSNGVLLGVELWTK